MQIKICLLPYYYNYVDLLLGWNNKETIYRLVLLVFHLIYYRQWSKMDGYFQYDKYLINGISIQEKKKLIVCSTLENAILHIPPSFERRIIKQFNSPTCFNHVCTSGSSFILGLVIAQSITSGRTAWNDFFSISRFIVEAFSLWCTCRSWCLNKLWSRTNLAIDLTARVTTTQW